MTLKITQASSSDDVLAVRLEGRLTADTVAALRTGCAGPLAAGRPVILELTGVSFADGAGAEALRDLERDGCVLTGCSAFLATLLKGSAAVGGDRGPAGPSDPQELALVRALRAGDANAFEVLVRRHSGPMLAVARRILANEDDARDAVQEAFVSAYRGMAGFDGAARLSTWLHRIVVNAALMKLRSRRRRPEAPIDDLLPRFDENGDWASGMAQPATSPEARIGSRQTRELVQRCIARLPDAYRVVLVLRDIEDRDTSEVAEQLGVSANAVKIRLHRARQALRTLIEHEEVEMKRRATGGRMSAAMAWCALLLVTCATGAHAATVTRLVVPGESIQAAIDASADGDVVELADGAWIEDVDFRGKTIRVVGRGPDTVVHGTGLGPVVTFASGETADSVLDSVTITGGIAERGGGVLIDGASPTLLRNRVLRNRARRQGSGIYLGASRAVLRNNLVADNTTVSLFAGDAHGVEIVGGAPTLRNNTIVDGDSNGIIVRAGAAALIDGNVIAHNGSQSAGEARGRGICDFSGGAAVIRHNLFWGNRRGALLTTGGVNYSRIAVAERRIADQRVSGNRDGSPRFVARRALDYRPGRRSRAVDLGDPSPELLDRDGTRNDAGYTGGPLAPGW